MAIKLIAFDIDDTLLKNDRTIGQRTLNALRAAHDRGVKIVPATGRGRSTMWKYVEEMGCADAAICTNGAQIYDGQGNVLEENPVPLDIAKRVARFAKENGWYVQGYNLQDYYFDKVTEGTKVYAYHANHMGLEVGDLEAYMTEDPFKMLFVETDPERMAELKRQVQPLFGDELCIFISKPFYLELTAPNATKGAAVLALGKRFGAMPSEIMTFGDSANDISMIEAAGVGVVMGNAREEIKEYADLVAPGNDEEGVAQIIEKYVLQA